VVSVSWVVDLLINVFFECILDTDVPSLGFDFERWIEEELGEISDFNFVKVML
jgi:hypothetical protein